jgi:hypothetical protein
MVGRELVVWKILAKVAVAWKTLADVTVVRRF